MIRYTLDKYEKRMLNKEHLVPSGKPILEYWQQHTIKEWYNYSVNNERLILLDGLECYPTSNYIVVHFWQDGSLVKMPFYQPQVWFLYFLYNNLDGAKKAIEFYVKRSYDVRERFRWNGIDDELKRFVMASTLSEGT